ncbi:GAF and ANTAR domain-containing protein [Kitasatospora sp. NPDC008115]|uniref:GAF and ANTAR domain-containing protein n=1 Tax=Kitasatospora sp. NPDC008115 TaxID=3364022 RepID=UPI0036E26DFE
MADLTRIAQIMAEAVNGPGRPALPERLCGACVEALEMDAAAITLMADTGHRAGVWASDEHARRLEERQFALGEGPGVDAFRLRRPVLVPDLFAPEEDRWPVLAATLGAQGAEARGLRRVHAFPLHLGASCIGVLSLHRAAPGMPGLSEIADIQVAATTVTLALVGSFVAAPDDVTARPWLDGTPLNGVEVDQAVGMIMVQLGVRAGEALDRLRAYAFAHDEEIDEIARRVGRRKLRFTEEDR